MKYNSGVYVIENGVNGHYYIGSSANLEKRFQIHLKELRQGSHHNHHLLNAFKKYGEVQFLFRVILFCEPEERKKYEEALIKSWKPDYNIGWNGQGVWEENERLRQLIEEQEMAIRPRKKNYGKLCNPVTPTRNRAVVEKDISIGKQEISRPRPSYADLEKLSKNLDEYHDICHSWRKTAREFNILTADGYLNPAMAVRIARGYEPKTLEVRKRYNLSPKCPTCQHTERRSKITVEQQEKLINATARHEVIKDDELYCAVCAQVGCKITLYYIETPVPLPPGGRNSEINQVVERTPT